MGRLRRALSNISQQDNNSSWAVTSHTPAPEVKHMLLKTQYLKEMGKIIRAQDRCREVTIVTPWESPGLDHALSPPS